MLISAVLESFLAKEFLLDGILESLMEKLKFGVYSQVRGCFSLQHVSGGLVLFYCFDILTIFLLQLSTCCRCRKKLAIFLESTPLELGLVVLVFLDVFILLIMLILDLNVRECK